MSFSRRGFGAFFAAVAFLAVLFIGRVATADFVGALVEVKVQAADDPSQEGMLRIAVPYEKVGSAPAERIRWRLEKALEVKSQHGAVLATIDDLDVDVEGDPKVSLSFAVTAGPAGSNFSITSTTVSFAPLGSPLAFATAAVTVTDEDSNGAVATGLFPGGKIYQARYNSPAVAWADLIASPVVVAPDDSLTAQGRRPTPSGREAMPGTVYSIASEFRFNLSPNDSASGTSTFDVLIPLPSAAYGITALLSCMGLARLRRQR